MGFMEIREFSKIKTKENISLRGEMVKIFPEDVKMVKENLKMEEEEDETTFLEIRYGKIPLLSYILS